MIIQRFTQKEEEEVRSMNKKRRQRQSLLRRRVLSNDVAFAVAPSLLILLLLSGSHLLTSEAFQFRSIQIPQPSKKQSAEKLIIQSTTGASSGVFLESRIQRKRQHLSSFRQGNSALSLSSPSYDGRSESGKNKKNIKSDGKSELQASVDAAGENEALKLKSNDKDALAEATALRAMAEELRAEARSMELEIKRRKSKQQQEKDAIVDEMIETLFLPLQYQDPNEEDVVMESNDETPTKTASTKTRIPDARVVADRLRQGKFTKEQVLAVVDRLFAQHHGAIHSALIQDQDEITVSNSTSQKQEQPIAGVKVDGRYFDYFHVFLQAASFLDLTFEDLATTTTTTTKSLAPESTSSAPKAVPMNVSFSKSSSPPPSFVTSGQIGKAIQSRVSQLRETIQADVERKIAEKTVSSQVVNVSSSMGWSHQYFIGGTNNGTSTKEFSGETPSFIPLWIPSAYIPYIVSLNKKFQKSLLPEGDGKTNTNLNATNVPFEIVRNSTLESAELEILKNKVLLGSRFYMTSFEFAPGAALFRGNMRTSLGSVPSIVPSLDETGKNQTMKAINNNNNTAMVFADIQERLVENGLGDRVQLFVLPDPEAILRAEEERPSNRKPTASRRPHVEASTDPLQKPVILALPKALTPDESKLEKGWIRKIGKRLSYPIAAMSMFFYSIKSFALNPHFFDALVMQRDATVLRYCIPLVVGFLSVQVIHEVAHYMVAKRKKIKIGFPVPVSTPFYSNLPFFGCITPLRSFPPNRAALVDFALSGPMASLAVSLCMVLGGVALTSSASAGQIARFPFLSVHAMKSNFLLGSILSWLLPKTMMLPLAQPIPMHPLFVIGRFGMISSALNLLPIFRLDGGRACFAVMGQRQGAVISAFTILWIISNFFMSSSMLLVWTLMVALFQMRVEIPCRDESTEVGGKRELLWFLSFMLSMSILVPFPHRGMH